jgi:hypothetical protein
MVIVIFGEYFRQWRFILVWYKIIRRSSYVMGYDVSIIIMYILSSHELWLLGQTHFNVSFFFHFDSA